MDCDHTSERGCSGGHCCYCDATLTWGGMDWVPCRRNHEYWRGRIIAYSFLPAVNRLIQQRQT